MKELKPDDLMNIALAVLFAILLGLSFVAEQLQGTCGG